MVDDDVPGTPPVGGAPGLRWPVVLFDLDGTLVESELGITRGLQAALASVGIAVEDRTSLRPLIGPPLEDGLTRHHGLDGGRLAAAVGAYRAYFDEVEVHEGIPELLADLRTGGARLAVATSKPERRARRVLAHTGLLDAFDHVVGASDDGARRHKRDVVAEALRRLGHDAPLDGAGVVLVGDRDLDVHGGRAAGVAVVAVAWGHAQPGELAAATPHAVACDVAELAGLLGVGRPRGAPVA